MKFKIRGKAYGYSGKLVEEFTVSFVAEKVFMPKVDDTFFGQAYETHRVSSLVFENGVYEELVSNFEREGLDADDAAQAVLRHIQSLLISYLNFGAQYRGDNRILKIVDAEKEN
jgi:hypothetical protein